MPTRSCASSCRTCRSCPCRRPVAERCARLRELLRRQGKQPRRRALDLTIAATAFQHGLTLVTRNTDDYEEVPGLTLRHP
ncbi:MAG TPA: type II toxin-antitoxin system VapC family toxin [Chloroflexota bacterium]|nr:type II toxin-antitoxin system VapC family toxin [Chloroflexota bacterium]